MQLDCIQLQQSQFLNLYTDTALTAEPSAAASPPNSPHQEAENWAVEVWGLGLPGPAGWSMRSVQSFFGFGHEPNWGSDGSIRCLDDYSLRRPNDPQELAQLLQCIDRLQAMQDEFFEFQDWVRETFEKNGCVMVPWSFAGPHDRLQEEMEELWDRAMKEFDDAKPATN